MITSRRGFTIVELLIVIVVIAILAAISIVAYNGVQQRARDSQRSSDIAAIKKALELYRIDNGGYPRCGANGPYIAGSATGNTVCTVTGLSQLYGTYLSPSLKDPINTNGYIYQYAAGFRNNQNGCGTQDSSDNYILGAKFETTGNVPSYNCWSITGLNYKDGTNN